MSLTIIKAQLADSADAKDLDKYISDRFYWEQKADGDRLLIHVNNGEVFGVNRKGNVTNIDPRIEQAFAHLAGMWVFDGERMGSVFWPFDLPVALDTISPQTPYVHRRIALDATVAQRIDSPNVKLLEAHRTQAEKLSLLQWCHANNAEGIMIKDIRSPYYPGKRSPRMLKAKFWESVDCVVREVGREGKRSVAVGFEDLYDAGSVTVTEKMLNTLKVGDVIEVKYLYCGVNDRLYQPSFLRIRTDKDPSECSRDQLKYSDKIVRAA